MSTIAVYRTATIPTVADGDAIEFEDGSTAVTGGLGLSGLVEGVIGVTIGRPWAADIGTAASPLEVDCDNTAAATFWNNGGGGALYYNAKGDNNLCLKYRQTGNMSAVMVGGTFTQIEIARQRVTFGANAVPTTTYVGGSGAVIINGSSGSAPTTVNVQGGTYTSERGATTINIYAGTVTLNAASNAITTINVYGGTINIQRCGTITNFNLYGGSQFNFNIAKTITITNTVLSALVPQSSAFKSHSKIIFTNAPTWIYADGQNF